MLVVCMCMVCGGSSMSVVCDMCMYVSMYVWYGVVCDMYMCSMCRCGMCKCVWCASVLCVLCLCVSVSVICLL